jgi:membrane-bound lytic murein transglycosylase D
MLSAARFCSFVIILLAASPAAQAALVIEPGVQTADSATAEDSEDLPAELFPLTEAPQFTLPLRSEGPTAQSLEEWHQLRQKILSDFASRIIEEFHVPADLRERTAFWFDIYTRYGEAHHVIHHALYPWIVFRAVDTTEILTNGKGPLWLRHDAANNYAKKQLTEVRAALRSLAKRKTYSQLSPLERDLFNKLMPVKGPRRTVFRIAADNVRSQLGQRDFFQRGLVNSSRYLPYMEDEFRRLGLPTELTRMPFVESSFNEEARSKVGASGIWQIMPSTGKAYMIVSGQIDERNAPLKATTIAGRLLHSYNHELKSWPLAVTSYNHGIGNIQIAIRRAHSRDLPTIIARYHSGDFKFASSNFYTCFLAALYAEKYNELIFKEVPREPLQEQEVIKLSGQTTVKYLQKLTGLTAKELLKYNLDLKDAVAKNYSLPRGYLLHLPPGYKDRVNRRVGVREKQVASDS